MARLVPYDSVQDKDPVHEKAVRDLAAFVAKGIDLGGVRVDRENFTIVAVDFTLDTNILIYAIDSSQGSKHEVARGLLVHAARTRQALMLQSLNEFASVTRGKRLISLATLQEAMERNRNAFVLVAASVDDLLLALQAQEEHNLPLWDALFWATARRAGCRLILSEDFQDGRELGGVRFVNPFKLSPREVRTLLA